MTDRDCLFCKVAAGQIPAKKVFENETYLAFEDIQPQAPVHILIIPKEHIPTLADLPESKESLAGGLITLANKIALEKGLDAGYRLVLNCKQDAGQAVFHIHLHLLGGRKFNWPPG